MCRSLSVVLFQKCTQDPFFLSISVVRAAKKTAQFVRICADFFAAVECCPFGFLRGQRVLVWINFSHLSCGHFFAKKFHFRAWKNLRARLNFMYSVLLPKLQRIPNRRSGRGVSSTTMKRMIFWRIQTTKKDLLKQMRQIQTPTTRMAAISSTWIWKMLGVQDARKTTRKLRRRKAARRTRSFGILDCDCVGFCVVFWKATETQKVGKFSEICRTFQNLIWKRKDS